MEEIYKEAAGCWFYENGRYVRRKDGAINAKIAPGDLPDPASLWQQRLDAANIAAGSIEAQQLRPSEATFKLWEHKNANLNN